MSLFAEANATYISCFGTSPPSRATVAVPLPNHQRVKLEVIGFDPSKYKKSPPCCARSALHVQGLSYWAPANIGPYSQAVMVSRLSKLLTLKVNARIHIAGQVPLLPASLTIPSRVDGSPYTTQAFLALQHVNRVIGVLCSPQHTGGGWKGWGESAIAWWTVSATASPSEGDHSLGIIRKTWSIWASKVGGPAETTDPRTTSLGRPWLSCRLEGSPGAL
jgi:diphthine-ammonia ligase